MSGLINTRLFRLTALLCSMLLAGCARDDVTNDLQAFVAEVKSRPGAEVEPVPTFEPYEAFVYSAASMRSPFDEPIVLDAEGNAQLSQDVEPDFERQREPLESQLLSELSMVGMLVSDGVYEALIEDEQGVLHRVGVGNYVGRNHGRIEFISETLMNIIEIVPSGSGGWVERPQTLTLR